MDAGEYLAKVIGVLVGFILMIGVVFAVSEAVDYYCAKHPSYFMNDRCFNVQLRCDVECSNYNMSYVSFDYSCRCYCDKGIVSMCSGHLIESDQISGSVIDVVVVN